MRVPSCNLKSYNYKQANLDRSASNMLGSPILITFTIVANNGMPKNPPNINANTNTNTKC